ncbi:unnamed protein product [Cylicocyclus nassatus]|uniref:Uncharacterized protein n=1 Tax=Cylicocyclus nassatus TaxID=53992 RepID=A0AA36GL99_CYLNA|nr:unnamed protein product [Cylicocyclus nassatus]
MKSIALICLALAIQQVCSQYLYYYYPSSYTPTLYYYYPTTALTQPVNDGLAVGGANAQMQYQQQPYYTQDYGNGYPNNGGNVQQQQYYNQQYPQQNQLDSQKQQQQQQLYYNPGASQLPLQQQGYQTEYNQPIGGQQYDYSMQYTQQQPQSQYNQGAQQQQQYYTQNAATVQTTTRSPYIQNYNTQLKKLRKRK